MELQLKGKRALITGSSAGLGEAVARLLAAEGAEVIVHGRNKERAAAVVESIKQTGGQAIMYWATCRRTKVWMLFPTAL